VEHSDLRIESITKAIARDVEIVLVLEIQPKLFGCSEIATQPQRRVCGDTAFVENDLI
jgi:hypothetical protein